MSKYENCPKCGKKGYYIPEPFWFDLIGIWARSAPRCKFCKHWLARSFNGAVATILPMDDAEAFGVWDYWYEADVSDMFPMGVKGEIVEAHLGLERGSGRKRT